MSIDAMVDIETTDVLPSAIVLTVGAVKFNPCSSDEPFDKREWRLEIDAQDAKGRTSSDSTMEFWARQPPEVQEAAFGEEGRVPLIKFFEEFNQWIGGSKYVWAQHPQFDFIILKDLYGQFDHHYNWPFWAEQDSATLFNLMPVSPLKGVNKALHNAAEDAYWQAKCVQIAFAHFDIKR